MADLTLQLERGHVNLSPVMFRIHSHDYFKAYLDFENSDRFSPIPFFLCCRAMELALKALHLESKLQREVKSLYSHDLVKSYEDLDDIQKTLTQEEHQLLSAANDIYKQKEFEYLNVFDAATAYARFPDLHSLAVLTRKVTCYDS